MSSEPPPIPPPPPPPPAPPFYPPYAYYQRPTDGMAITALVLGIIAAVGVLLCYGIPSVIAGPIAIFLGLRAQNRIRDSGGALGGRGLAMAGWITGLVATIIGVLVIVFFVFFIGLLAFAGISGAAHATPSR